MAKRKLAASPEDREKELIAKAVNLAEKQLDEGTASASVITHYLKLATAKEKLEQEKLAKENTLLVAKTEAMDSAKRVEDLYIQAMDAMRRYAGYEGEE